MHMLGCGIAGLAIVVAIAVGAPILAAAGALMCAAMMIGMVWMMVTMGKHH